jgi:hypothetical protein
VKRNYTRSGLVAFGHDLFSSGDLDPVYVALRGANMERSQLHRWLIGYWYFYDCGFASYASERVGQHFWHLLSSAAINTELSPLKCTAWSIAALWQSATAIFIWRFRNMWLVAGMFRFRRQTPVCSRSRRTPDLQPLQRHNRGFRPRTISIGRNKAAVSDLRQDRHQGGTLRSMSESCIGDNAGTCIGHPDRRGSSPTSAGLIAKERWPAPVTGYKALGLSAQGRVPLILLFPTGSAAIDCKGRQIPRKTSLLPDRLQDEYRLGDPLLYCSRSCPDRCISWSRLRFSPACLRGKQSTN